MFQCVNTWDERIPLNIINFEEEKVPEGQHFISIFSKRFLRLFILPSRGAQFSYYFIPRRPICTFKSKSQWFPFFIGSSDNTFLLNYRRGVTFL